MVDGTLKLVDGLVEAMNKGGSMFCTILVIGAAVGGWFFDKLTSDVMMGIVGSAVGYLYGTSRRGQTPTGNGSAAPSPPTTS